MDFPGQEPVRLGLKDGVLWVQYGFVTLQMEVQAVHMTDCEELMALPFEHRLTVPRVELLKGLRSVKALGNKRVRMLLEGDQVELEDTAVLDTMCCVSVKASAGALPHGCKRAHEVLIEPMLTLLSLDTFYKEVFLFVDSDERKPLMLQGQSMRMLVR